MFYNEDSEKEQILKFKMTNNILNKLNGRFNKY